MKTLYHNGLIYTGQLPLRQAFAVEDGRFCFVGSEQEALALDADSIVDLEGRFVCAGFNDSHMHLLSYGRTLSMAPLGENTASLEGMLRCLGQTPPQGGWILGRGWNQDRFTDVSRMPNRWDLDRVSTELPVCATRACGHALVVNSRALEILGITADTAQIEGGEIVMENGVPNGLFFDNAMDLILEAIPAPGKEEIKDMLRSACAALNSYGITSCHSDDYCVFRKVPWETVNEAYRELEETGELTVRVNEQANFTSVPALEAFLAAGNTTGSGSSFFRIGPLKLLGDGALGARTAYLSRPYADAPHTRGLSVFTPEEFDALIGCAHANGMQAAIHCIGDACLDLVLNSLEKAMKAHPRADHRHGIVHCQITRPDQLDRMAQLGLHIYAQSIFLDYDTHIVKERVGEDLAASSYRWKTLMTKGLTVSNGSDCPVELPHVMAGIQCAVTRKDRSGRGEYLPEEAFTIQEALDSYTKNGARASFEEAVKGCIREGMLADFVILGADPFAADTSLLQEIPVLQTFLQGRQVYPVAD